MMDARTLIDPLDCPGGRGGFIAAFTNALQL